jgi:hypothetical protein
VWFDQIRRVAASGADIQSAADEAGECWWKFGAASRQVFWRASMTFTLQRAQNVL